MGSGNVGPHQQPYEVYPTMKIVRITSRAGVLRRGRKLSFRKLQSHTGLSLSVLHRAETDGGINLAHAVRLARFYRLPVERIWMVGQGERRNLLAR